MFPFVVVWDRDTRKVVKTSIRLVFWPNQIYPPSRYSQHMVGAWTPWQAEAFVTEIETGGGTLN